MSELGIEESVDTALGELVGLGVRHVALGPLTTCRVGGPAAVFVEVNSVPDIEAVARAVGASGLPLLTIGRGSNLLVSDRGFPGIAMVMGDGLATIGIADDHVVTAGAATPLPVLARRTVREALTGLEWAVGVPGSVGGAIRMNAGGHGADIAASLIDARILDMTTAETFVATTEDLELRFRGSNVTPDQVVISGRFGLRPGSRAEGENVLSEIVRWRRENQPGGQNAGSVFVNPFDGAQSAGRLIDEIGLKGLRYGSAHVSMKHGNFIQVDDGGSAEDVRALMEQIVKRVEAAHGIRLRSEIRLIGFDDTPVGDAALDETGSAESGGDL